MSADNILTRGPNVVHPEIPSAVGSRNSINRDQRDEYMEGRLFVDEEVDKILNHIHSKLPPEVLSKMEVMTTVKSKLHNYYNQNMQNMLNRYLTTVEDEMGKKVRDLVDMEEMRSLNRYSPRAISYLLDRVGGSDKFHTGELERSIVNMYGHLHGHVQREMNDLETTTNSLLRRKTDVGAFVRGENAYAIAKCSFRDHPQKPENVMMLKLALNIDESELISRIYPYQTAAIDLLKDVVTNRITESIDKEIEALNEEMIDSGKPEISAEEKVFERIKALEKYTSDDTEHNESLRYAFIPKKVFDGLGSAENNLKFEDFDALGLRDSIISVIDKDNIRSRGWNTAINSLTHVLDWSRMGYQHIENFRYDRRLIIREYETADEESLPDERYQMVLNYYTDVELHRMQEAFLAQLNEFQRTVDEIWKVVEEMFDEHQQDNGVENWENFSSALLGGRVAERRRSWFRFLFSGDEEEESEEGAAPHEKKWNEIHFIHPEEPPVVAENSTYESRIESIELRFPIMCERMKKIFGGRTPMVRALVEGRVRFLENEFKRFTSQVNPYHMSPGLLLDIDIVSIKRKSATMMNMANVLNEFLSSTSSGFQDQAFASFSRRRSTERSDIAGEFASSGGEVMGDVPQEEGIEEVETEMETI